MTFDRFKQKLSHPMALVAQGFVAGSILFWATAPGEANAQPRVPATHLIDANR